MKKIIALLALLPCVALAQPYAWNVGSGTGTVPTASAQCLWGVITPAAAAQCLALGPGISFSSGVVNVTGSLISGTFTSAQVLNSYAPSSYGGRTVNTTDMGFLLSDGVRWQALSPPIPAGAAILGYNKNLYTVFPTTADITYTTTTPIPITRLYSGFGPDGWIPPSTSYSTASNGQLGIQYPSGGPLSSASLLTTENAHNSQLLPGNLGYEPFLLGSQGFYVEIAVTLSGNNTDNWFAFFLEPQEHNTTQNDHQSGDVAGFERWTEFDVNENGHGTDYSGLYRGAWIKWFGFGTSAGATTFTTALSGTSGTIATGGAPGGGNVWPEDSATYNMTTSTSQVVHATFTKGSASVTWTPTITGSPTSVGTVGYDYYTPASNVQTASLDYASEHIFGLSYDPIGQEVTFWQDGVMQDQLSTSTLDAVTNNWHYFPIIQMNSHGSNVGFTGSVRYISAWTQNSGSASGGAGTVTTSGSPVNGNLAKFSAPSVVTNGDLSGDVTTSGTLAATVVGMNGATPPASAGCIATNSSGQLIACTTSSILSGTTGTISGSVANGACDTGTATGLTGISSSMAILATPASSSGPGTGWSVSAYMSATGTATVQVCNATGSTGSPTSAAYNVRVIP